MTIQELRAREKFRCVHGHNGVVHPRCYDRQDKRTEERIGFADIESSNLTATFGIVYTFCIKELDGELIKRAISLDDLHAGVYDKNLVKQFIDDALGFDRLIFHYGVDRFDLPFLRSRAVKWNLPFPAHRCIYATDTYPILKNKFRLHSNRLETACEFLGIPAKKHKLNSDVWLSMITGNRKLMKSAIDYILQHNIEDVLSLEALYQRIAPYARIGKTSI